MQIFANAVKDRQNQLTKSNTAHLPDVTDDTSRDLFDDYDEIVPETQELPETQALLSQQINSEDSGESVCIPFYDKKNTCDSESLPKRTDDSDNESEYMQVRPESNVIEPVADQPQSQFIMADMDRSLMHDLEISAITQQKNTDHVLSDSDDSTLTTEIDMAKQSTQTNENSEKDRNDRSGSTTPDLEFPIDAGQGNSKESDTVQTNGGKNDENQQNSESIFEKCTQQFCRAESAKDTSTEDIFAVPTQLVPIFKHPAAASSTPYAKTKSKRLDESIYDAATQLPQEEENEEDVYDVATQIFPSQKHSTTEESKMNQNKKNASKQNEQEELDTSGKHFVVQLLKKYYFGNCMKLNPR